MKLHTTLLWSITFFLMLLGTVAQSQTGKLTTGEEMRTNLTPSERILLVHHLGSRPDDAPDLDNVHGGDFPEDDPDSWDPGMDDQGGSPRPDNGSS